MFLYFASSCRWVVAWMPFVLTLFYLNCSICWAQTQAKNRQDERQENQRVDKTRKELGQTQSELRKLQADFQSKSNAFLTARRNYLQSKKKSDSALEQAQERVGESLGIPAQLQVIRGASLMLQDKSKLAIEQLKASQSYLSILRRLQSAEAALDSGVDPSSNLPILPSQIESLESSIAADQKSLFALEQAAIAADPVSREAKEDLDLAQKQLKEIVTQIIMGVDVLFGSAQGVLTETVINLLKRNRQIGQCIVNLHDDITIPGEDPDQIGQLVTIPIPIHVTLATADRSAQSHA